MDKITRIHLAKIPYEISITAQAALKKYLDEIRIALDANLADEIMADVEVRITEILSERNIKRNGVITSKDIDAVQKQLGSPEQFTDNDTKSDQPNPNTGESKRLLRDTDSAYIGGVASGIGAYFNIDPIFIRLIFIVLAFVSGLGIALYILFWLLVPAAKSSSEKLQMSGQPVTVATLQRYRGTIQRRFANQSAFQKVIMKTFDVIVEILKVVITTFSALASLYILGVLGVGSSFTFVYPFRPIFESYRIDYVALGLLWVIGLSLIGLLITLIMRIWGHRSSQLKFSVITFVTALIIAIASSGATGLLVYNHFSDEYGNGKDTKALVVNNVSPNTSPTKLAVKSDGNLNLTYVITNQPIHATYQAYPGLGKPAFTITNNSGVLTINSNDLSQAAPSCLNNLCRSIYLPIHVTLYGPAVTSITDNSGAILSINNANLGNSVSLEASNGSTININNSYAKNMNISATSGSTVQTNNTSAQQATVNVDLSSNVSAPTTNSLTATVPNDCAQSGIQVLYLNQYSGKTIVNNQIQTMKALNQNSCVSNAY